MTFFPLLFLLGDSSYVFSFCCSSLSCFFSLSYSLVLILLLVPLCHFLSCIWNPSAHQPWPFVKLPKPLILSHYLLDPHVYSLHFLMFPLLDLFTLTFVFLQVCFFIFFNNFSYSLAASVSCIWVLLQNIYKLMTAPGFLHL